MIKYDLSCYTKETIINRVYDAEVDISVLILFFNRPSQLARVFEQVKKARPSRLFLYQDGARQNNLNDEQNIEKCRKVVEPIDWNCTVYRMYQENNYGCDPSEFISQKWAFSLSDKCIVLEDDDVPAVSFFAFCKEMLDKYENDKRIYRVSGQNILGHYSPYSSDYFFTKGGSIWGWASWRRVIDEWDEEYSFIDDKDVVECLKTTYCNFGVPPKKFLKTFKWHRDTGKEYYESIFLASRLLGSGLTIVPSNNLISNIGISPEATHGGTNIHLFSKNVQKAFNAPVYEMSFPIKHPNYILEDKNYENLQSKMMGWKKSIFQKIASVFEERIRKIIWG